MNNLKLNGFFTRLFSLSFKNVNRSFLLSILAVAVALSAVTFAVGNISKDKPADEFAIKATPERVARGEYLVKHVAICLDCHSEREWTVYSAPAVAGTEGMGGERFGPEYGMPGTLYPRNITPAGIGHWTDADLIKALTQGVNKDGETLFPLMPYMMFRNVSQEDIYSIVTYIRTLEPVENDVPKRELAIPIEAVMPTTPPPVVWQEAPDRQNTVEYGKYLVNMASCIECHSKWENGQIVAGMEFAGGYEFHLPSGNMVVSQNITPDVETGIGGWDKQTFIAVFKSYKMDEVRKHPLQKGQFNTIMPWSYFSGMTEEDLGAIYDYLRTLKPIKNRVPRFVKVSS
jgi:mono/diheme cytochrome c family protein